MLIAEALEGGQATLDVRLGLCQLPRSRATMPS